MKPLSNKVLVQKISASKETDWGFTLKRSDGPDQAKVISIGPDVTTISVGDVALVDWNDSVKVNDDTYLLTEDKFIGVFEND